MKFLKAKKEAKLQLEKLKSDYELDAKKSVKKEIKQLEDHLKYIKKHLRTIKNVSKEDLLAASSDKDTSQKICEELLLIASKSKEDSPYLSTVVALAHNAYHEYDITDLDSVGKFLKFVFDFKNLNYQVGNGGFSQYFFNNYEGIMFASEEITSLKNANKISKLVAKAEKIEYQREDDNDLEENEDFYESEFSELDQPYYDLSEAFIEDLDKLVKSKLDNNELFKN